ncbi:Mannan endo-1,6-alpha-mannosidase [Purpureocillium takamizusanense]|uniref:Mannan endo-1,6-alpha-mannosidase n=1 Tax=Purpureocillium takamizusanense TaxID=2060973 RepID=A0A9Q8QKW6_9HYPO|nr:Mannan endo-1,6-alpha-mannosidase [Purpureocillium takamizusanense]UNI21853.1 Mannan endo-1,6-alpha-mannosidase [Purpureocillium takamizusanense]
MMKFVKSGAPIVAALSGIISPKDLNVDSPTSIRNVAATVAHDAMSYYKGNVTTDPNSVDIGDVPDPYYWWVAGALWGAMLDYYHYTEDPSYNDVVLQALLHPTNLAPTFNYVPKEHAKEEGNDDLFFWGSAVMSAAERNFPQPDAKAPAWIDIAANVFNSLVSRWDAGNCNGGLLWQIYADNPNGMTYKNSISNGGLFQLAARLARATGNQTYLDWAEKAWDWSAQVGIIDPTSYHIYDGVDIKTSCKQVNKASFTYTSGVFIYGAAVMANHTGKSEWVDRTSKLIDGASWFFQDSGKSKNVMYEAACEPNDKCNYDMITFKGYLSRFMWQTSVMLPSLRKKIEDYMLPSVKAAASVCTGGKTGRECGMKWYTGSFDNKAGLGPQMCALEAIQGLLIHQAEAPLQGDAIKHVREAKWKPIDTYKTDVAETSKRDAPDAPRTSRRDVSSPTKKSDAAGRFPPGGSALALVVLGLATTAMTWAMA